MISIVKAADKKGQVPVFNLHVGAQLFNNSSDSSIDMNELRLAILKQMKAVYNFAGSNFSVSLVMDLHIASSITQISRNKLLFCIQDEVRNGNPAEADFKGLRIALNKNVLDTVIPGVNTRTLPHELGHIFGWEHPHARGKYESINPEADRVFEQSMTEAERKKNLMSQTWYIQTAGLSTNEGTELTLGQLELVYKNFQAKKLNNNYHIKGWLWWKRLV